MPDAITTSRSGDLVVKQGSTLDLRFRPYDEFGVYPQKLKISMDHSKDGLYSRYFQEPGQAAVEMTVRQGLPLGAKKT